jgi:serralysin
MATYVFEQMTQAQGASFTADDTLVFLSASASDLVVSYNAATNLTAANIVLGNGSNTVTFNADALAAASQDGELTFVQSQDGLYVGGTAGDDITVLGTLGAGTSSYGFAGADTIDATDSLASDTLFGGAGNDVLIGTAESEDSDTGTEADYFMGGAGADSITGSFGNDHIYGNSITTVAGDADGDDTIFGGAGNDYIQGNAGNDVIDGGEDNDRIYGGAGDDSLVGGDGWDYIQGNKGEDSIDGGAGSDFLRGGAGNDVIFGGEAGEDDDDGGNDTIMGDAGDDSLGGGDGNDSIDGGIGDDTIVGGEGYDILSGGDGDDIFFFAAGDADIEDIGGDGVTDAIADFTQGDDFIFLGFEVEDVLTGSTVFSDLEDAYDFANGLLANNDTDGGEVAAVQVGSDTYLFFDGAAGTADVADSVIKLAGITATDLEADDFNPELPA